MNKKWIGLVLVGLVLSACTMNSTKKKKKSSSSEESSSVMPIDPKVTGVSLNRESLGFNLNPEHSYRIETLIATVSGEGDYDKSVKWSTSNDEVATVDNGLVSAVDLGTCDITCESTINEEAYAICHISVVNDVPVVESVSISPDNPSIDFKNGKTVRLTAIVQGQYNPSQAVTWSTTSDIASVDQNGLVTATATGSAVIKATSQKDTSKYGQITVSVIDTTPKVNSVKVTVDGVVKSSYALDLYEPNNKKTVQLGAQVDVSYEASQEVNWSSSDNTIAEVSSTGLVTAKSITKVKLVTITATSKVDSSKYGTIRINVEDNTPRVLSVTVSLLNDSIKVGQTTTASADVDGPLEESQKTVKWSSSNPSVATIDPNTGLITALAASSSPVTITATADFENPDGTHKTGTKQITIKENVPGDAYTVMLYVCGADLESGWSGGQASGDIKEILAASKTQPDDVNIIIETGGASRWNSINGVTPSSEKLERWEVKQNKIEKIASLSNASMGSSSTLQSFVEWGIGEYYADKMALIFWNHGGGLDGCCYDENHSQDGLTEIEISTALTNAFKNKSFDKLEWIGFDCCLKQNFEEAIINKNFARYQVASQISEWGDGWNYTPWVDQLYQNPSVESSELLTTICDEFVADYDEYGNENVMTLSWLDLSKIDTFVTAFKEFTSSTTYTTIKNNISKTITFDSSYRCYDVGNILTALSAADSSAVQIALGNLVGHTCYRDNAEETSEMHVSYKTYKPKGLNVFIAPCYSVSKSLYQQLASTLGNWYTVNYQNM